MTALLTALAFGTLGFFAAFAAALFGSRGYRRNLGTVAPCKVCPPVSVIIAARNEQRNIAEALSSVMAQDYPAKEIVVVNDRSTDATGAILEELGANGPQLHVVTVTDLPPGWLGKNHALWLGAQRAQGDILLFTDADVVMEPSAVSRAVSYMERTGIDHLAVGPEVAMKGWILNCFAAAFMIFFTLYARPWAVRNPKSGAHIGIGAFNMVRRKAYQHAGGHRAIAMRPDDDMKLGKLIKKKRFRQDLLAGRGMLRVEWYASAGEMVRGLEKNTFAGVNYNWALLIAGTLACLLGFAWPFAAVLLTSGITWWCNLGVVGAICLIYFECASANGIRLRYGLGLPLATLLFVYVLWRSAIVITLKGGIDWRGTHYGLEELKKNRV
ncbi:glycosyltransferase family 2 protein [uncultured Desulfuromonas sp.]|uniref:glycosyltransferase n=1 Tax=uncultured Desulfuromonas sp. TaxID=181013 RepID=UPI0026105FAE|nr:glycosyltransferase family 2 protein [uncultured Desulfuromonas sp.]